MLATHLGRGVLGAAATATAAGARIPLASTSHGNFRTVGGAICAVGVRGFATQAGRKPSHKELIALRSSGIVLDGYETLPSGGWPLSPSWFRVKRRQGISLAKSAYAGSKFKSDSDFSPETLADKGMDLFSALHRAAEAGNEPMMRECVTNELFAGLRLMVRQPPTITNANTTKHLRMIGYLELPKIVQMRAVILDKDHRDLYFAQVTVEIRSQQSARTVKQVMSRDSNSAGGDARKKSGGGGSRRQGRGGMPDDRSVKHTKAIHTNRVGAPPPSKHTNPYDKSGENVHGQWRRVYDDSCRAYYLHPPTGHTQWEQPENFGVEKAEYHVGTGTLGAGGEIMTGPDENGLYTVRNVIVLERPIFRLSQDWRICSY